MCSTFRQTFVLPKPVVINHKNVGAEQDQCGVDNTWGAFQNIDSLHFPSELCAFAPDKTPG